MIKCKCKLSYYYLKKVADKFARTYKIARVHKIELRYFCMKTFLHDGIKLHQDTSAQSVTFARIETLHGISFYFFNLFFYLFFYH